MSEEQNTGNLPTTIENAARVVWMMARDGIISVDIGAPPELAEMARYALGLLGSLLDAAEKTRGGEQGIDLAYQALNVYSFQGICDI